MNTRHGSLSRAALGSPDSGSETQELSNLRRRQLKEGSGMKATAALTALCGRLPRVVAMLVGVALLLGGFALPAAAEQPKPPSGSALQAEGAAFEDSVKKLEKRVVRNEDGTLTLAVSSASAGVAKGHYEQISAGLAEVNRLVRDGQLATNSNLDVYASSDSVFAPQSTYSAWYWHWWGVEVHLSAYWTNKLLAAGNIAAAGAALCGATGVCAAPAAIVAAIFWLGASVIQWCSNSRGVVLKRSYAGPTWCHGH